jgi:hypothetical protein
LTPFTASRSDRYEGEAAVSALPATLLPFQRIGERQTWNPNASAGIKHQPQGTGQTFSQEVETLPSSGIWIIYM